MKTRIHVVTLLFLLTTASAFGQSKKEQALAKGTEAMKLEEEGKMDEAIKLLEEAEKLDPGDINYPYELAYAYYVKEDYAGASKKLESILKHKDVNDRVYQLLGNSYDNLHNSEKAMETYQAGLKKFPNSGYLYLETGIVFMGKEDYNKALENFETGIKVSPKYSSNYYWAARIFCNSTEEVWGMIYGELFMNLERNSKRTAEISKLLYDTYKSQIEFSSDTSMSVSFSKNATIDVSQLKGSDKIRLPFGVGVYEPTLLMGIVSEKSIDIHSLDRIRTAFLESYYKNGNDKDYPNILFEYQDKIHKAGHFEAYNHWLLMKGEEDGFAIWKSASNEKWTSFVKWFNENEILVDDTHKFYSAQYEGK